MTQRDKNQRSFRSDTVDFSGVVRPACCVHGNDVLLSFQLRTANKTEEKVEEKESEASVVHEENNWGEVYGSWER